MLKQEFCLKSLISPPDPEHLHTTGGVGCVFTDTVKVLALKPITSKFAKVHDNGRCMLTSILFPNGLQVFCFNLYCWVNANTQEEARARTDDMFDAVFHELDALAGSLFMIACDLNSDLDRIPLLLSRVSEDALVDLGAHGDLFNVPSNAPTCHPHNSDKGFRRDFFFVSPALMPLITAFDLDSDPNIP
eukprot:3365041-Karenia_brevis.AAC.1